MIPSVTVSSRQQFESAVPPAASEVLARYEAALTRMGASVEQAPGDRLVFRMPIDRPKGLGRFEADLGFVGDGVVDIHMEADGYSVRLTATPRAWFVALALVPWAVLVWALGWTPAPWRWLLTLGGLPLPALLWLLTWLNLDAFVDETSRSVAKTLKP